MAVAEADAEQDALGIDGIPRTGEIVGGKFLIESILGVGGMGVVVSARHIQLGQTVAIKFLRRSASRNEEAVNRFLREARASVGLQSAHVVRVMDVGTLDEGVPFMVMEHLTGTDLGQFLELRRSLKIEEAVDYVLQAMDAVAEAHLLGIVHRDLKPSNLFLSIRPDGSSLVKVLDFGISKVVDAGQPHANLTSATMVLGSPLYMSPEQVRSTRNVDTRTDIWALGVILYELIAGAPPFEAETVTGLCAKIVADPPIPLRVRRPGAPASLDAIIARCLEKEVARRPRSVADLALELRPYASEDGRRTIERILKISASPFATGPRSGDMTTSRSRISVPGGEDGVTGYSESVASWRSIEPRRGRRLAATIAIAALLVGALVFVSVRVQRGAPRAATDAPEPMRGAPRAAVAVPPGTAPPGPTSSGLASSEGGLMAARDRGSASVEAPPSDPASAASQAALPSVAASAVLVSTANASPRPARASGPAGHPSAPKPTSAASSAAASHVTNDELLLDRK